MTQELGSLAVSLSLDAASFNGTISQVNQNMRAMGSELQAIRNKGSDYEKSIDGMREKQDVLQRSLTASSVKLEEERRRYDDLVASGKATEAQLARQANAVNRAQAEHNKLERQLREVSEELERQQNKWVQASQKMDEFGQKASAVGGKMKDLGGKITAGVSAPIIALGAASIATAAQFDNATAKIQNSLGVTGQEAKKLESTARKVWKDGFGDSMETVSDALIKVKQNIKGISSDAELERVTRDAMLLSETFDSDVNEVTRAAQNSIQAFGVTSKEAFDTFAKAAQNGANFSNEMFDNISEYAPLAAKAGYSFSEYMNIVTNASSAGVYNLDYVNDLLKETQIRLKDGSKATGDAMKLLSADANEVWNAYLKGDATVSDVMPKIVSELSAMEDQTLANQIGVALMGTKFEDMESDAVYSIFSVKEGLEGAAGSMDKMAEAQDKTFSQRWQETLRTAQTSLIPLGEELLDIAEVYLPKISGALEGAAKWFNDLSPVAKDATLAIGGIAVIAGPVIAGTGMIISSIGAIVGAVGPLVAGIGGFGAAAGTAGASAGFLGTAIGVLSGPVGWAILGIAALTAGGIALYKNWEDIKELSLPLQAAIYGIAPGLTLLVGTIKTIQDVMEPSIQVTNDWKDSVSEATATAVTSFLDLSDQATVSLNQLAWSGAVVTQEMANNLITIYDEMGQQIIAEMQEGHAEQLQTMTEHFASSTALTEQEEAEILTLMQTKQAEKETAIAEGQARIAEILNTAKEEKRALTEAEQLEINSIQQAMTENAIQYMSESEVEQKVILENLKNEASRITAEQAAEVVKNSVEQKEQVVKEAQDQYDKAVAEIIRQRDEMGTISEEQATKLIDEAQRQRDETVKKAEEMHQNVVSEAQIQADEHVNKVDWETGEIKSKWQVMKEDVSKKMSNLKDDIKNGWTTAWNETKTKVENIRQGAINKFTEMRTGVENKMTEVKTKISNKWNEAEKFLKEIDLKAIGKDIVKGLVNGINEKVGDVVTAAKNLGQSVIDSVSNVLQRRSPARKLIEVGHDVGDGLAIGIDDKQETVKQAMRSIGDSMLDISRNTAAENKKIQQESSAKISEMASANAEKIKKIEDKADKDILSIKTKASKAKRSLTSKEKAEILAIEKQAQQDIKKLNEKNAADILKQRQQTAEKIQKATEGDNKKHLEAIQTFINDKKSLEQLSLVDEAAIWEKSLSKFKEGTDERIKVQQNYQKAVDAVNKEIESINKTHQSEMQKINDEYIKQVNDVTKAYQTELDARYNFHMNSVGKFDKMKAEIEATGEELLENLRSQVDGFKLWQSEIEKLSSKNIDANLLKEITDLGVKALPELLALNTLTEDQLNEYSSLYQEKSQLAREQAEAELIGMKTDMEERIVELREAADEQLTVLESEWKTKIQSLTKTTSNELSSLRKIGQDAGQGLLNGLASMEGPLIDKARAMANSIAETLRTALEVNSPSRLTRRIAVNVGEGVVLGLHDMMPKVQSASLKMAEMVSGVYDMLNLSENEQVSTGTGSVDNSRHFAPSVTIYTQDSGAKAIDKTLKRLALKFT